MSKRQEIRARRNKEKIRNRILAFVLVIAVALVIIFALILPSVNLARTATNATQTAQNASPVPVITVTPRTFTAKVNGRNLGDPNAPVKVVVYEDFRCSACLDYTQTIEPTIIQNYVETGKVYYSYAIFLVIDGNDGTNASFKAANAALCASEQNRFWDYHDTLYANQISESATLFTDDRLTTMAQNIGLDMTAFNQCFKDQKYSADIQKDVNEGVTLKVTGTPSVFINGTLVQNFTQTIQSIDDALAGK